MLSVIVPVYNVEDYIDECIQSILYQTYVDLELILIDDGSTDQSLEKCKQYEKKDTRVRVLKQEHRKAAAARNTGIRNARGDFLTFVDSDDYIQQGAYEKLVGIMDKESLDIIRCSYMIERNGVYLPDSARKIIPRNLMSGYDFFDIVYGKRIYCVHVGIGIYRTQYILENKIYFTEGITHEDELWIPKMIIAAERIQYLDYYYYYYRYREGSVMNKKDKTQNGLDCIKVAQKLAEQKDVPDRCRKIWDDNILGKYFFGFTWGRLYRKEYRHLLSKRFVFSHVSSPVNALRALIFVTNYKLFYIVNKTMRKL